MRNLASLTHAARISVITTWPVVASYAKRADAHAIIDGFRRSKSPSDYDILKRDNLWCVVVPPEQLQLADQLIWGGDR